MAIALKTIILGCFQMEMDFYLEIIVMCNPINICFEPKGGR